MIPIAKPNIGIEEKRVVCNVINSGMIASGKVTKKFEKEFAGYVGTKYAISCNSGTSALHLALLSLGISRGDEVILPDFTFVATANAVLMCGATPVFCDVDPNTFNINPDKVKKLITKRTMAIIPVHLFGYPVDVKAITEIADEIQLYVIGDACQSHGSFYGGKKVGSFFDMECFSFYPTKNMTTGEGGMITTDKSHIKDLIESIRNHGRTRFGQYDYDRLGYNYRMTDISASIGLEQLKKLPYDVNTRRRNAKYFSSNLYDVVETPYENTGVFHSYNQYTIKTRCRNKLIDALKRNEIGYGIYYPKPLHHYPHLSRYAHNDLKVSDKLCKKVLSLPVHPLLTSENLEKIKDVIMEVFE